MVYELFLTLGTGNPKYASKVQNDLIGILSTRNIPALRLGLQAMRRLLDCTKMPAGSSNVASLAEKTIQLLGSGDFEVTYSEDNIFNIVSIVSICVLIPHHAWFAFVWLAQVQYEAFELIATLAGLYSDSIGLLIVNSMRTLLLQTKSVGSRWSAIIEKENEPDPVNVAQASAAKVLYVTLDKLFENKEARDRITSQDYIRSV